MSERKKRWKPGSDFLSSAAAIWMVPLLALFILLLKQWSESRINRRKASAGEE